MEKSVLLIKPDGFASSEVKIYFDALLAESTLSQDLRYVHHLSRADVLDAWPKFDSALYPITREFNILFMTSGPSEAVCVSGADAVAKCSALRGKVRSKFGSCPFGNFVHTPTERHEVECNVEKFWYSIPSSKPFERPREESGSKGIYGKLARTPPAELDQVVTHLWHQRQRHGWSFFKRPPAHAEHAVTLLPGDPHSIDYGISLIHESVPRSTVEHAIAIYLEAEAFGEAEIASGGGAEMACLYERFKNAGMFVRLDASGGPTRLPLTTGSMAYDC